MGIQLDGVWKDWDGRALVQLYGSLTCLGTQDVRTVKGELRLIKGEFTAPGFIPADLLLKSVMPKHELLVRIMDIWLGHKSDRGEYYNFEGVALRVADGEVADNAAYNFMAKQC